MTYKIEEIEGIGPSYAQKLVAASIATTDDLLKACRDREGRKTVAETTGIGESTILKFTNMADLMRISGVGKQFAELLHAAGVDTLKELRTRNPENLADAMTKINAEKQLTKGIANADTVGDWIEKAKGMEPGINY